MFHFAFQRGQRPAYPDLPPTLLPSAVAASAPPSDHLRAVIFSGLVYFVLVAAGVALSRFTSPPVLAPVRPPDPEPTFVYDPPSPIRLILPPIASARGGDGPDSAQPNRGAAPADIPSEAPVGLPTENHAQDKVGTGAATSGEATSTGTSPTGTSAGPAAHDFAAAGLTVLRQVEPSYPEFARRARIQGPVVLMLTVDEQGQPIQVQVMEGHPAFHDAARQAARQWRFEPARINGRPVTAAFRLTLNFTLR